MKYHIYNRFGDVLYWGNQILEFDTKEHAQEFLASSIDFHDSLEDFWTDAQILLGDIGDEPVIDASYLRIDWDEEEQSWYLMTVKTEDN